MEVALLKIVVNDDNPLEGMEVYGVYYTEEQAKEEARRIVRKTTGYPDLDWRPDSTRRLLGYQVSADADNLWFSLEKVTIGQQLYFF